MASKPNIWNYDDPPLTPLVSKLGSLAGGMYSSVIKDAKVGIDRFFSLYLFVLRNLDKSPETLRTAILNKGVPIFSVEELRTIMNTIKSQKTLPFAQRLLANAQIGGQPKNLSMGAMSSAGLGSLVGIATKGVPKPSLPVSLETPTNVIGAAAAGATAAPGEDDNPATKKFWDLFFKKRLAPSLATYVPTQKDQATPLIFALYGLENLETVGPLISTFLDSVTLGLPTIGELLGIGAGTLIQLAPIPYAGIIADGTAYAISLLFIMISSLMSLSRKQFGTAFTVGLGAVPIIGDTLSDAALLFEKQYERYVFNKKRLLKSVDEVSPHTAEFLDYWAPDVVPKTGPPPTLDGEDILLDVMGDSIAAHGIDKTRAMLDPVTIASMPTAAQAMLTEGNKKGGRRRRKTRRIKRH